MGRLCCGAGEAVGADESSGGRPGCVSEAFQKEQDQLPAVCLIVSGGHTVCMKLKIRTINGAHLFAGSGGTRDDARGEAYDKVAKLLGLDIQGTDTGSAGGCGGNGGAGEVWTDEDSRECAGFQFQRIEDGGALSFAGASGVR
jgi:hypothetical protein